MRLLTFAEPFVIVRSGAGVIHYGPKAQWPAISDFQLAQARLALAAVGLANRDREVLHTD